MSTLDKSFRLKVVVRNHDHMLFKFNFIFFRASAAFPVSPTTLFTSAAFAASPTLFKLFVMVVVHVKISITF